MEPRVRLAALGDVALVRREALSALSGASGRLPFLHADIVLANLETPLGKGDPAPGKINLSAPEEAISFIRAAGINIVNLANNHIMDYGEVAAKRTIRLLEKAGIHYFGVGTLNDMANPIVLDVNGLKLAFMGYASPTTHPIFATANTMGCDRLDVEKIVSNIQAIKQDVDYVVVSLHWGLQDQFYPMPKQIEEAHTIIDAGAHVIISHHAHVFQSVEHYRKGIIFYGLGNFIFPNVEVDSYFDENDNHRTHRGKWYDWNQYSLLPLLEFGKDKGPVQVARIFITKFDPTQGKLRILRGTAEIKLQERVKAISRPISWPYYSAYWKIQKRANNLRLMWGKWKSDGFEPSPNLRHIKALFNQVIKGKLTELDDNNRK